MITWGRMPAGHKKLLNTKEILCIDEKKEQIPWRWEWLPTPVFLSEKSKQKRLAVYSPRSPKESDTTEQLTFSLSTLSKETGGQIMNS